LQVFNFFAGHKKYRFDCCLFVGLFDQLNALDSRLELLLKALNVGPEF
jgi:hypothetical protein